MRQAYGSYRNSATDWLEEIPEHWQELRLKATVERSDIRVEPEVWGDVPYIGLENVAPRTGMLLVPDDGQERLGLTSAFTSGDVLFGKLRPYLAKAFCAEFDGLCSTEFLVLKPHLYERRYLLHLLLTNGFVSHADSSTFGARMPRTDWGFVGNSVLPVPPQPEQVAIGTFLDYETSRINKLISMQVLLIERLAEYRTALITQTVTCGLPPAAAEAAGLAPAPRLKETGIQWLGKMPEHWEQAQLRRMAHLAAGEGIAADEIAESGAHPVYGGNGIRGFTDGYTHDQTAVLIGRQGAMCGNIHVAEGRFWASEHAVVAAPHRDVCARWLAHLLGAMNLNQYSMAAAQPGLSIDRVNGLLAPLPPLGEQHVIAQYLESQFVHIDALRVKAEELVERLSEFRSALISAAVTGKIDVRDAVPVGSGDGA